MKHTKEELAEQNRGGTKYMPYKKTEVDTLAKLFVTVLIDSGADSEYTRKEIKKRLPIGEVRTLILSEIKKRDYEFDT